MGALKESEQAMTKFRTLALSLLLAVTAGAAMAHGPHGGYRGGYYRGDYFWGPALVGGAIVGTSIYLSRPVQPSTVIVTTPPAVVVTNPQPTQWVNGQPVAHRLRRITAARLGNTSPWCKRALALGWW